MPLIERKVQNKSSWRDHFKINKKLLPLKFTLFFFSASAFSILPYLTIHMKDIGIKVEHIALMYAILPFTIFFGKNNSAQIKKKIVDHITTKFTNPEFQFPQFKVLQNVFSYKYI